MASNVHLPNNGYSPVRHRDGSVREIVRADLEQISQEILTFKLDNRPLCVVEKTHNIISYQCANNHRVLFWINLHSVKRKRILRVLWIIRRQNHYQVTGSGRVFFLISFSRILPKIYGSVIDLQVLGSDFGSTFRFGIFRTKLLFYLVRNLPLLKHVSIS